MINGKRIVGWAITWVLWPFLALVVALLAVLLVGCLLPGCAALRDRAGISTDLMSGNRIGGGGDSVSSWLREVGFWFLAAVLYYPAVHRPIRRRLSRDKGIDGAGVTAAKGA